MKRTKSMLRKLRPIPSMNQTGSSAKTPKSSAQKKSKKESWISRVRQ